MKDNLNNYKNFKKWYKIILADFNFNPKMDKNASDYLLNILRQKGADWQYERILELFINNIKEKDFIFIYGCGPSLEETVDKLLEEEIEKNFKNSFNLAADGASVLLKEKKIPINCIFTDLDGITKDEFYYSDYVVVHAHGDNLAKLEYFKDDILTFKNVIGTTQCKPSKILFNPGGFTDGDRILYFIRNLILPTQKIFLIGMDFGNKIGKYSKPNMKNNYEISLLKAKKLQYAVKLIEDIIITFINPIYFINSKKSSDKFQYISISDFKNIIKF